MKATLALLGALGGGVLLAPREGRAEEPPPPPAPAEQAPVEVSVRAAARARDPGRVTVTAEEARHTAGNRGDALEVVGSLPGVGRPSFDNGRLVVWGASPKDTQILVDGVEVPALYHGSGVRGVVPGDLVQSIDLVPGGFGAEHGRALGGLVRLTTRELPKEGIHGFVAADFLDASALVTAALGDRVRLGAAGRVSYLDRLVSGIITPASAELYPIPRYRDYQGKASFKLREDEALDVLFLGSGDDESRVSAVPGYPVHREKSSSSFHRFLVRYTRDLEDQARVEVTPFFGRDDDATDASVGSVPEKLSSSAWKYGVRASYRLPFGEHVVASVGLDALGTTASLARAGSLNLPPREGDPYVFGQPPGADVASDQWSVTELDVDPYVAVTCRFGPLTVTPGLRLDTLLIDGSRGSPEVGATPAIGYERLHGAFEPRLAASLAAGRSLTFSAATGVYHQAPEPADLSAVFGTPALTVEHGVHFTAGEAARLAEGLTLETTGFYRKVDQLVVRSRLASPTLAQALTQDGEGRAYGVQVLLRRERWHGLSGWLSYTGSRSERRYKQDPTWVPADQDQTHVVALVVSGEWSGWGAGLRFRYATGAPRTPVTGSFYETTTGQYEPLFGAPNSIRLPDFYQLDLRASKRIVWPKVALEVSLDVLNATYHKNAEELVYSPDYGKRGILEGLPTLAILGARVEL